MEIASPNQTNTTSSTKYNMHQKNEPISNVHLNVHLAHAKVIETNDFHTQNDTLLKYKQVVKITKTAIHNILALTACFKQSSEKFYQEAQEKTKVLKSEPINEDKIIQSASRNNVQHQSDHLMKQRERFMQKIISSTRKQHMAQKELSIQKNNTTNVGPLISIQNARKYLVSHANKIGLSNFSQD